MPVVGTGFGGGSLLTGVVVKALLSLLHEFAQGSTFDMILVCFDRPTFALAQSHRLMQNTPDVNRLVYFDPLLSTALRHEGDHLAEFAVRGKLALFLGAGISGHWKFAWKCMWVAYFAKKDIAQWDSTVKCLFGEFRHL